MRTDCLAEAASTSRIIIKREDFTGVKMGEELVFAHQHRIQPFSELSRQRGLSGCDLAAQHM